MARQSIKALALPFGLTRRRRRGDLAVLAYHRVGAGSGEISMPSSMFERQLQWIAARGEVRRLDDALDHDAGGVVVTFDDGYRDFIETVVPLLQRYSVPAVLYLATGLIRSTSSPEGLTWEDLSLALSTGLVTIGSHTHGHVDLSAANERQAEEEMLRSMHQIEDHLSVACRHFAYPWAVGSPAAERVARRLFDSAALHAWKTNRRRAVDPHRLGRTPILRSDGLRFFKAKASGLLDHEAVAYRLARRGPWDEQLGRHRANDRDDLRC